jgi:tetratricopeptide (TPR) repeat protein
MRATVTIVLLMLALPVGAQKLPRPTEEGQKALDDLIRRCVAAGGLQSHRSGPGSGSIGLTVADAAKLRAAVAADCAALTSRLRDALVARWAEGDTDQEPVIVALLRAIGGASDDDRALAFAAVFEAWHEEARQPGLAIRLYTEATERFAVTADRAWQAACQHNIGSVYYRQGEYARAMEGYRKALDILRAVYGEQDPNVATCYNNIADVYRGQGEYAKALEGYRKALEILLVVNGGEQHPSIAICYRNIAGVYFAQGDSARALAGFRKALEIRRAVYGGERHRDVATSYMDIAIIQHIRGEFTQALEGYRKALDIARVIDGERHPDVATCYNNSADIYDRQGEYARALEGYRKALEIRLAVYGERHPDVATCYHNIAHVYCEQGEYARALENNQKALDIRLAVHGDRHPAVALSYNNIATVYDGQGDYARALEAHRKALEIRLAAYGERHSDVATSYSNIALVYYHQGDYTRALDGFQKALDIMRAVYGEWHPDVATCYNNIAGTYTDRGEYAQALEVHRRALEIQRAVYGERHPVIATSYNNIAGIYSAQGEYTEAMESYLKALDIMRAVYGEQHPSVATCYNNIADVFQIRGEYTWALKVHQKALEIRRAVCGDRHPDVALSYHNIAGVYLIQSEYARALEGFRKALEIERAVYGERHPAVATSHYCIAGVYDRQGEHLRALEGYQKALEIRRAIYGARHPDVATTYYVMAPVYFRMGEMTRALDALDRALDALSMTADPTNTPTAGRASSQLRPLPLTVSVLQLRGCLKEQGLGSDPVAGLRDCLRDYQAAADVQERVRQRVLVSDPSKLQLGEGATELYPWTIGVAARLAELEGTPAGRRAALAAAERGAARVFMENLGRARASVVGRVEPGLRAEESRLLDRIGQLDGQIDREQAKPFEARNRAAMVRLFEDRKRAEDGLKALVARLERDNPLYAALKYARACTPGEAQACLAEDEIALVYVLGLKASFLIVLSKDDDRTTAGLTIHTLPAADRIIELMAGLWRPTTLEDEDSARELGRRAYQMLLAPAAGAIRGKGLIIVPGGVLGLLPFELLVEPAEATKDAAGNGRFLVEGHRIRYAPSMTALHFVRRWDDERQRPERTLWALGDPVYQPTDERLTSRTELAEETRYSKAKYRGGVPRAAFERLPSASVEVEQLRRLWDAPSEAILVGPAATEAAVKAASAADELARYRYVHFATHGILGLTDATPPSLVLSLAGDQHGEDGFLTLGEVTGLRLNADLVVLSACQTGQGRLYNAEGVSGLARAFLYAGSRGVLCSLWRVDDEATAGLMTDIYAGLKEKKPAADALRDAQLKMITDGQPPLYWAPFILIGQ